MYPIIDLHCDTIMALYQHKDKELLKNDLQIDLLKMKEGNYLAQTFAMFVFYKVEAPFKTCNEMIDLFYQELEKNSDKIKLALSKDELLTNYKNGYLNAILSIEEGGVIGDKIEILVHFYNRGVRMICLNWNFVNGIGHPNFSYYEDGKKDFTTPNTTQGLTPFGIEVVKKMDELGMIIDVSHLSDKGFWDVYNNTTKPFIASHSNSRSVCNHTRNLTDEMIKALSSRGGVIGLNFATDFINGEEKVTYVKDIVKHALHIIEVGGVDCLAIGTDFDGINRTTEIDNASMMPILVNALLDSGLSTLDVEKICYKNFLRVYEKVVG